MYSGALCDLVYKMSSRLSTLDAILLGSLGAFAGASIACHHTVLGATLVAACGVLAYVSFGISTWKYGAPAKVGTGTRKLGSDIRPPYPDGWFVLAMSHEVQPGGVVPANIGGIDFVVWRPRSGGPAVVMDAHCPHLGANLAVDGTVDSDCLRCPFHGWKFDTAGELVEVPGCVEGETVTPPQGARVKRWPSIEQNGLVSVWVSSRDHSASPAKTTGPWYHVPAIPEISGPVSTAKSGENANATASVSSQWTLHGWTEHFVPTVIYDIPENGADVSHLPALHAAFLIPALSGLFSHWWRASWEPRPKGSDGFTAPPENNASGTGPFVDIVIEEAMCFLGRVIPGSHVHVDITQCGPTQVYLQMRTGVPGLRFLVIETVTPVAPAKQRVLHLIYAPWWVPRAVAKIVLLATARQFSRDVPIWGHKRYEPRPLLSKADRGIPAYRRWAAQFYGPASLSYEEAVTQHVCDSLGLPRSAAAGDTASSVVKALTSSAREASTSKSKDW